MPRVIIRHVDAFTSTPLEGNPAAVVDGAGIHSETMQRIALNQKLSETVFLLPPEDPKNHARARIFTPASELPFAGHPIIATAHTLISEGIVKLADGDVLRIETGAGVIPVAVKRSEPPQYTMTQVPPKFRESDHTPEEIAGWLGLPQGDVLRAERVSTGLEWRIAQLASLDAMLRVERDHSRLRDIAIFCIGAESPEASIRVRAFAPQSNISEDPITGSANGCIAAFIAKHGLMEAKDGEISYIAEQGIEMGQPGRVQIRVTGAPSDITAHVGGSAVTVLRGELLLPD